MRKLLIVVTILGALIALGGVLFLHLGNFYIANADLWTNAYAALITDPAGMIQGAMSSDGELLAGLLAALFGMGLALSGLVALSLLLVVEGPAGMLRRKRKLTAARQDKEATEQAPAKVRAPRLRKPLRLPKITLPRRKVKQDGFEDGPAMIDEDAAPKKGFPIAAWIEKLKSMRPKKVTKEVILSSGKEKKVIAEISEDTEFFNDLRAWHKEIRSAGVNDPALLERARKLEARATRAVLERVREEDPMNGEFLIRMLQATARREDTPKVITPGSISTTRPPEDVTMSRAISDVMKNGIADQDSLEEEGVDLDEGGTFMDPEIFGRALADGEDHDDERVDSRDLGITIDGKDYGAGDDPDVSLDGDDQIEIVAGSDGWEDEGDDAGSGGDQDADVEVLAARLGEAIRSVRELENMAREIREIGGVWTGDLADQAARVERLEVGITDIEDMMETAGAIKVAEWIDDGEGDQEWDWLEEHRDGLDAVRRHILELIIDGPDDEDTSGQDEDEGDTAGENDAPYNDDQEYHEGEEDEDLVEGFSVSSRDFSKDTGSSAGSQALEPQDDPAVVTPVVKDDHAGDETPAVIADQEEDHAEDEDIFAPSLQSEDQARIAEQKTPAIVVKHEPRDVGLDQLAEVEMSDQFLTKWGYAAKAAGAAEAKLVHTVLQRDGARRRVLGVVHMVALWRGEDASKEGRLNLIFRHIPEGLWSLDTSEGLRMNEQAGDFVEVKSVMLEHAEVAQNTTVVHFYGPGVPEGVSQRIGSRLYLTDRVMSSDEIKRAVLAS